MHKVFVIDSKFWKPEVSISTICFKYCMCVSIAELESNCNSFPKHEQYICMLYCGILIFGDCSIRVIALLGYIPDLLD